MTTATDILIELQFRLPNHTYRAVKRHAEGLETEGERIAYLKSCLSERDRSEGRSGEQGGQ